LLLLSGHAPILNFRDVWYFSEWSQIFDYGQTNEFFKNIFFNQNYTRAGGLYHNPNTLAGIVLLYFIVFDYSWKFQNQNSNQYKKHWKIFFYQSILFLIFFSLMLTKSRTIITVFFLYVLLKNFNFYDFLLRLKIKKVFFCYLILLLIILFYGLYSSILDGFTREDQSMKIKLDILKNYLMEINLIEFVIGGNYNVHFDTEWGSWFGATGFLSFFAIFFFYKMFYQFEPQMKVLVFVFILISFGSTLFYNLMYTAILIPLFIIVLSYSNQNLMKKNT
jgi:hypothetical protein